MTLAERFPKLQSGTVRYAAALLLAALAAVLAFVSARIAGHPYVVLFAAAVALAGFIGRDSGIVALVAVCLISPLTYPAIWLPAIIYAATLLLVVFGGKYLLPPKVAEKGKLMLFSLVAHRVTREDKTGSSMIGCLDGVADGEAFGWALDTADPAAAPLITITVDGRPAGETRAVTYRPDIGAHAFYFDVTALANRIHSKSPVEIAATLSNGMLLTNAPQTISIPGTRALLHEESVLFMHISKSAGTAFREAILPNYRVSQTAWLYPDVPGLLGNSLAVLPLEQRARLLFIMGHFQHGIHTFLPRTSTYVTIVRDPIARILSEFRYALENRPGGPPPESEDSTPLLVEMLERRASILYDNLMVRCFAGISEDELLPGHVDRSVYRRAVENMERSFLFIGHQESSQAAFDALAKRFGWQQRPLPVANRGALPVHASYRAATPAIERFNNWDCELYAEILRRFPRS